MAVTVVPKLPHSNAARLRMLWQSIYSATDAAVRSAPRYRGRTNVNFQDYPEWDEFLRGIYTKAREEHWEQQRQKFEQEKLDRELRPILEYFDRSREYAEWCRTSPEWRALSDRILWRSRGWCKACLVEQATVVHHITYASGKLPPAWHLRAVCSGCHDRMHAGDDEWCEFGMGRV